MTRREWFHFSANMNASDPMDGNEVTSLVKFRSDSCSKDAYKTPIAIDWWVHVGGPIRSGCDEYFTRHETRNTIPISMFMKPDPVLSFEIESWLRHGSGSVRFETPLAIRDEWLRSVPRLSKCEWSVSALTEDELDAESLAWARQLDLFSSTNDETGIRFMSEMATSGVDLREPPWLFWSRWLGWLKHDSKKTSADGELFLFAVDSRLTFLRCALSPQDELSEAESLDVASLMVNPTFETIERPRSFEHSREMPLLAIGRFGERVTRRRLSMLEAMILDHVRESFRIERARAVAELSQESGVHREFIESAMDGLLQTGLLLGRIDDGIGERAH